MPSLKDNPEMERLSDAKVVVTGSNGFIGQHLTRKLRELSREVVAIGRQEAPAVNGVKYLQVDIRRLDWPIEADYLFHLAGMANPSEAEKDPVAAYETNVSGTVNLIRHIRTRRRTELISSVAVYGKAPAPFREDVPVQPSNVYGATKLAAEDAIRMYGINGGLDYAIVRPSNIFGPGQSTAYILPEKINQALSEGRITLRNGSIVRDYVFVDDFVEATIRAATMSSAERQTINIGSGQGTTLLTLAEQIRAAIEDPNIPITSGEAAESFSMSKYLSSIDKAKGVLGWEPQHTLLEGLQKSVGWYRERLRAV